MGLQGFEMTQSFDEWYFYAKQHNTDGFTNREFYEAGAASRQTEIDNLKQSHRGASIGHDVFIKQLKERHKAEIDELQKSIDVCEKLRDSQFDKLWGLTQAIEAARHGADEDFDLFLNYLSNILKGKQDD